MADLKINFKLTTILLITTLGIFSLLIILLILVPTVKRIFELKTNIQETQIYLEEQYEKTKNMRRSVYQLGTVQKQVEIFNTAFLNKDDELMAITTFEDLANRNKLKQEDIKVTYASKTNLKDNPVGSPYYTFSLVYSGKFLNQFDFLKDVEKLPFYVIVENIRFEKKGTDEIIYLRFDARIYAKELATEKK